MAEGQKRSRGGQFKDPTERKRNNLTFRVRDQRKAALEAAAAASGRSVSEEIEFRLNRDFSPDIDQLRAEALKTMAKAAAVLSASYGHALRAAGFQLLREIEGKPVRAIVDLGLLLAETDVLARRSGFFDPDKPLPAPEPPRSMTPEEERLALEAEQRALKELEKTTRRIDDAVEETRARDAAAANKSDDEAA